MTLRKKTMGIVGLTLAGLLLALYTFAQITVMGGFAKQEQQEAHEDMERVLKVLDGERSALEGSARDWSVWDDTYAYIQDSNDVYLKSNLLGDSSFNTIRLN